MVANRLARSVRPKPDGAAQGTPARDGVVIEASALQKTYDTGAIKVAALRGVDLKVRKSEVVSIMGPSGCGKTTLLNCLSGIDDLSGGSITIEGQELGKLGDDARSDFRARRMGFVFQSYNLSPVLTAVENVELPLLLTGTAPVAARRQALATLESLGLVENAGQRPLELSGGQQQRVAIARALVNEPAILWADEPTGNLDTETALKVMETLLGIHQRTGQTIVMVTHDDRVGRRSHRILRMDSGRITEERPGDLPTRVPPAP